MLDLSLEPTDDLANPAFKDKASCEAWLNQLQLTNLHHAHALLRLQLDEFNRFPLRGLERLHTLEVLRETIVQIQTDYAKKLISKKLPFSEDELTVFVALIGLWQGLVTGYQRCLQAYLAGDKQLAEAGALMTQRCLRYSGLQIFEHLRSGYEFDGKLWHQLHALFAFAEEQGVHQFAVVDELHSPSHPNSCQAVYAKTLLDCYIRPSELTRSQLQLMDRWLNLWGDILTVDRRCTVSKEDAPPLAVDLSSMQGLVIAKMATPSASLRFLPMVPLSKMLRVKTILLQQGQTPSQLELGSESNSADCIDFLNKLHANLCEENVDRQAERRPVSQSAVICFGIEGVYAHIARKPFRQPKKEAGADSLARKQIAAFGRILSDTNRHDIVSLGFALENWKIENESISGARLLREDGQGERLGVHQLIAVKPADAKTFMLGKVSWCTVTRRGYLRSGVQYFLGIPEPISIKWKGINSIMSDKAEAALLLPALPALKTLPSVILPRDSFRPDRLMDIIHLDNSVQTVKLGFSVDKGADYERVSFTPA